MSRKRHRLLLADDHPALRESVAATVADDFSDRVEVVAQAGDGPSTMEMVRKHPADLIVLDLGMPRSDGIGMIQEIKRVRKELIVLVFSMYDDQSHVVEAIRAGADHYLFKNEAAPDEVVRQAIALLERSDPPDTLRQRLVSAVRNLDESRLDMGMAKLTPPELEVLSLAAHRGLSMKEIAAALTRAGRPVTELTVRKHFEHLYGKIGARSQAHAVCLAVKLGFISAAPAEPGRE